MLRALKILWQLEMEKSRLNRSHPQPYKELTEQVPPQPYIELSEYVTTEHYIEITEYAAPHPI